jgi:hypothetical protein
VTHDLQENPMQVSTVSDPKDFTAKAGDRLYRHPVANNVLLFHAVDPMGMSPGDGRPLFKLDQ